VKIFGNYNNFLVPHLCDFSNKFEKPIKKFIELNKMTGEFEFVEILVVILNQSTYQ
jgi:hypothetical protein